MNNTQQPKLQMNEEMLKSSTPVSHNGNQVFAEGVVLRKISKFLIGAEEHGLIPIPVFFNPKTGEILLETLPKMFREEYETYNNQLKPETQADSVSNG